MVQATKTKDAQQNNLRALYHDRNVCSPSWKVSIIRPRAGLGKSNRDLCQLNSHFPPPVIKINQAETEHFSSVIFVKTGDMTKWCQEHLSHSEESTFYKWLSFSHNNPCHLDVWIWIKEWKTCLAGHLVPSSWVFVLNYMQGRCAIPCFMQLTFQRLYCHRCMKSKAGSSNAASWLFPNGN